MPTVADIIGEHLQDGTSTAPRGRPAATLTDVSWQDLGEHVRRARIIRRETQAEFAAEVGLSVRTIGSLEAGERCQYDETTIVRIESALGWAPGSVDRVVEGRAPTVVAGPYLARILDIWPRLPRDYRRVLAYLAAALVNHPDGDPPPPSIP